MNPELERLLAALAARDNAAPADFPEAHARVERLLAPILDRLSPTGRSEFLLALQRRYRAISNPATSLPPCPPFPLGKRIDHPHAPYSRL